MKNSNISLPTKKFIIVTGLTRCGKTAVAPLLSSLKNCEQFFFNTIAENLTVCNYLKLIDLTKNFIKELYDKLLKNKYKISDNDLIVEPSAGNGSFISGIKSLSKHHIFYDLEPENAEIVKQDYLTYDYTIHSDKFNNIHVIGNPPFGRQSSLAIKFIKNRNRNQMYLIIEI